MRRKLTYRGFSRALRPERRSSFLKRASRSRVSFLSTGFEKSAFRAWIAGRSGSRTTSTLRSPRKSRSSSNERPPRHAVLAVVVRRRRTPQRGGAATHRERREYRLLFGRELLGDRYQMLHREIEASRIARSVCAETPGISRNAGDGRRARSRSSSGIASRPSSGSLRSLAGRSGANGKPRASDGRSSHCRLRGPGNLGGSRLLSLVTSKLP